jgi:hypothetical protein
LRCFETRVLRGIEEGDGRGLLCCFEAGLLRGRQESDQCGILRCLETRLLRGIEEGNERGVLRCFSQCGERPAGSRDAAYVGDGRLTPQ